MRNLSIVKSHSASRSRPWEVSLLQGEILAFSLLLCSALGLFTVCSVKWWSKSQIYIPTQDVSFFQIWFESDIDQHICGYIAQLAPWLLSSLSQIHGGPDPAITTRWHPSQVPLTVISWSRVTGNKAEEGQGAHCHTPHTLHSTPCDYSQFILLSQCGMVTSCLGALHSMLIIHALTDPK